MTRLTKTPSAVTLTGAAELITLPCAYSWVWVRNDGDKTVYISQTGDVGEGVAGTVAVPAGSAARLALTSDSFCTRGTGVIQVAAANYTDCPFKAAPAVSGGGVKLTKIAALTRATTSDGSPSMEIDIPVGTVIYARLYSFDTHSYDKGYRAYCDIYMQILDVAENKYIYATEMCNGFFASLKYVPSTKILSVAGGTGIYAAEIYSVEGVTFDTD